MVNERKITNIKMGCTYSFERKILSGFTKYSTNQITENSPSPQFCYFKFSHRNLLRESLQVILILLTGREGRKREREREGERERTAGGI
jgi:hypothetical protein